MNNSINFRGRKLAIATIHQKEKVIAPLFEKEFGVECIVPKDLNTDSLGTFSGEIERIKDPFNTAIDKCNLVFKLTNCDLAISNEGSFGPHPSFYFAHANEELVVLVDKKNNFQIFEREISLETNFNAKQISSIEELNEFAHQAKFPSHGLILRKSITDYSYIKKGIICPDELTTYFLELLETNGSAYIETDMRAMYNPTRMKIIENTTKKLVKKIQNLCPYCNFPGFSIQKSTTGLPCSMCYTPTKSILSYTYSCLKCDYSTEIKYPNNLEFEDPMYCDLCNP